MRNETIKRNKYIDAWESFIARNDEDTAQSRRDMRFTNANRGGAPKISTFGMCLSGAFIWLHVTMASQTGGCEFFQRNVFNCVAKAIMSGIRICKANAPTALPMDHAVEILQMESTLSYPERVQPDTPELRDIQHPRNQPPPPVHLRDFSNHPMDAIIPTSSNTNPSTASDVRSRPISTNLSRCSEHISGPYLKDKFTPRKSSRNAKRQSMVINIDGYKKWSGNAVNKPHMEIIWGSCVKVERTILYIQMLFMNWSKIWKKEIQHGIRLWVAIMKVQWQGHSLLKKTVVEIAKFDIWNRKCLIKYSLTIYYLRIYDIIS